MKKTIGFISLMILGMLTVSAASPIAVDDTAVTNEDTPVVINVITNDTDADLDILTATSLSNVTNWTATITSSWIVTFTPTLNFNWTWGFDYVVNDWSWSDIGHATVTVNPVNDTPIAVNDTFSMVKNTTATINLTWNDTDVDWNTLTVTSLWTILNWVWTISSTSTWVVFTPSTNFVWVVSFDYTVSDWTLTDVWTVNVSITNNSNENDDEDENEDENEDVNDDNGHHNNKYVQDTQKEYIQHFKDLKNRYKHRMSSREYKNEMKNLQEEYKNKLKEIKNDYKNAVKAKYNYQWDTIKSQYKAQFKAKYWKLISKMDDTKLNAVIWKIDALITSINASSSYTDAQKTKLNTMLLALREVVSDNLGNTDNLINIDALFE